MSRVSGSLAGAGENDVDCGAHMRACRGVCAKTSFVSKHLLKLSTATFWTLEPEGYGKTLLITLGKKETAIAQPHPPLTRTHDHTTHTTQPRFGRSSPRAMARRS